METSQRPPVNIVSSFFYYMWNCWNEEECKHIFVGWMGNHVWSKWCYYASRDKWGAAENFFADLDLTNRELLVNRAIELYDGQGRRKETEK